MAVFRTGNNTYAIQAIGPGPTGRIENTAGHVDYPRSLWHLPEPAPTRHAFIPAIDTSGPQEVIPDSASWVWTGATPTVRLGAIATQPPTASRVWTGATPTVSAPASVSPASASWLWTSSAPTVQIGDVATTPASSSWLWGGQSPAVQLGDVATTPAPSSRIWSGQAPMVELGIVEATPPSCEWVWSAAIPTVDAPGTVTPLGASWLWSGSTPTLDLGAVSVAPASSAWVWTGGTPTPSVGPPPPPPPPPPPSNIPAGPSVGGGLYAYAGPIGSLREAAERAAAEAAQALGAANEDSTQPPEAAQANGVATDVELAALEIGVELDDRPHVELASAIATSMRPSGKI